MMILNKDVDFQKGSGRPKIQLYFFSATLIVKNFKSKVEILSCRYLFEIHIPGFEPPHLSFSINTTIILK